MIQNLQQQLKRDEGEILHVYLDSMGIPTAGVGHNLRAHGINLPVGTPITQAQSDEWLQQDISLACSILSAHLSWVDSLGDIRRAALQNMCFNMGIGKLLGFHHFLGFMESGNYEAASGEMLNSAWAVQVGARAKRLSLQVKTGVWQ